MKKLKITHRIALMFTVFSALILAVLVPSVYSSVKSSLIQALQAELQMVISGVFSSAESVNGKAVPDIKELEESDAFSSLYLIVYDPEGKIYFQTPDSAWLEKETFPEGESKTEYKDRPMAVRKQYFEMEEAKWIVVASESMDYVEKSLGRLRLLLLLLIPVFLGLSAFGAFMIAQRSMEPIRRITRTADEIGRGDLSKRIVGIETRDEVGELSDTFNQMLEQLEVSFKRERQFTSDASHELRTPVTVISACVEDEIDQLIRAGGEKDPENPENAIPENLLTIRQETRRMSRIISQLLTLSRGYEGRYRFESDEIDLYEMAQSVLESLEREARDKNITAHNEVPEDTTMVCDQSLMTQLFFNLIGNAIKYGNQDGNIWIRIQEDKNQTRIMISDDGIGISPEDLPHIFERFYRADKARDRSGTGLGLSIVKWIVDMHHGEIMAESEIRRGTVFTISIPR